MDVISSTAKKQKLAPIFMPASTSKALSPFYKTPISAKQSYIHFSTAADTEFGSKIAAFDLDGTIISPKSGSKFPKDEFDWEWWNQVVPVKLTQLHQNGFTILFISNQAGKPVAQESFQKKLLLISRALDKKLGTQFPFHSFAALRYDEFRKPSTGLWDLFRTNFNGCVAPDLMTSFFVGDAAGRKQDHSDTDRKMAENASLTFYTPEQFFLEQKHEEKWHYNGWNPKTWIHTKPDPPPRKCSLELVLFVGCPASGKTTYYQNYFKDYVHINQDLVGSRPKCLKIALESLTSSKPKPVVIDATNSSIKTRAEWIDLVTQIRKTKPIGARIIWFDVSKDVARHNSVYRAWKKHGFGLSKPEEGDRSVLPIIAFHTYFKHFEMPSIKEGFDEIHKVNFRIDGAEEQIEWARWFDVYPIPKSKK